MFAAVCKALVKGDETIISASVNLGSVATFFACSIPLIVSLPKSYPRLYDSFLNT